MVDPQRWRQVNAIIKKRGVLEKEAQRLAARATQISRAEGGTATYKVRSGIRPGGRAYVDVVSDNAREEYGDEKTKRIGALRRALRGG